jgi:hypothetical protein
LFISPADIICFITEHISENYEVIGMCTAEGLRIMKNSCSVEIDIFTAENTA